jgi:hypothetical protein
MALPKPRRLFALDQNFPEPIVDCLSAYIARSELVPIRRVRDDPPSSTTGDCSWSYTSTNVHGTDWSPTMTSCWRSAQPHRPHLLSHEPERSSDLGPGSHAEAARVAGRPSGENRAEREEDGGADRRGSLRSGRGDGEGAVSNRGLSTTWHRRRSVTAGPGQPRRARATRGGPPPADARRAPAGAGRPVGRWGSRGAAGGPRRRSPRRMPEGRQSPG